MSHIEEVSTLFLVGFPEDINEREFNNMFIFANGFEAAMLKTIENEVDADNKYQTLMGFAKFSTRQEAIEAQQILNGKLVDTEKVAMLKVELAKKNLHIKRKVANPEAKEPEQETNWESFVDDLTSEPSTEEIDVSWMKPHSDLSGAFRMPTKPGMINNQSDRVQRSLDELLKFPIDSPFSSRFSPFSTMFNDKMQMMNSTPSFPPAGFRNPPSSFSDRRAASGVANNAPVLNGDHNPPCNTLYVGNLPPNTIEEELRQLFSTCSGYKRLCVRYKAGANPKAGPMCFVEFETEDEAAASMSEKNGALLSNSEKGGIRLSFSKNPLGVRRQPPNPIDTTAHTTSASIASAPFRPAPLSSFSGAPGLSFPGFSTPVTPTNAHFKSIDRPLAPWS